MNNKHKKRDNLSESSLFNSQSEEEEEEKVRFPIAITKRPNMTD